MGDLSDKQLKANRENAKKGGRPEAVSGFVVWDTAYTGEAFGGQWFDSQESALAAWEDFLTDAAKAVIEYDRREGPDDPKPLDEQVAIERREFLAVLAPATRSARIARANGMKFTLATGRIVDGSKLDRA